MRARGRGAEGRGNPPVRQNAASRQKLTRNWTWATCQSSRTHRHSVLRWQDSQHILRDRGAHEPRPDTFNKAEIPSETLSEHSGTAAEIQYEKKLANPSVRGDQTRSTRDPPAAVITPQGERGSVSPRSVRTRVLTLGPSVQLGAASPVRTLGQENKARGEAEGKTQTSGWGMTQDHMGKGQAR